MNDREKLKVWDEFKKDKSIATPHHVEPSVYEFELNGKKYYIDGDVFGLSPMSIRER